MGDKVKTLAETDPGRKALLAKVSDKSFVWHRVPLTGGGGGSVAVSLPVKVDGVFVPVTAAEQKGIAARHGLLPLTRAVADQSFNDATRAGTFVPFKGQYPHLFDYDRFTAFLDTTAYGGSPQPWAFGAHKLWLLSRFPNKGAVNYGFFGPGVGGDGKPDTRPAVGHPNLAFPVHIQQDLGGRHDAGHWDYSQLLQLMKELRDADGNALDLRAELLAGNKAVWDEATKLQATDLP
jgi:hypothetical protein